MSETDDTMASQKIEESDTQCFTYEVVMIVQVLASSKDAADAQLDAQGGYVSKRTVNFVKSTLLHDSSSKSSSSKVEKS